MFSNIGKAYFHTYQTEVSDARSTVGVLAVCSSSWIIQQQDSKPPAVSLDSGDRGGLCIERSSDWLDEHKQTRGKEINRARD